MEKRNEPEKRAFYANIGNRDPLTTEQRRLKDSIQDRFFSLNPGILSPRRLDQLERENIHRGHDQNLTAHVSVNEIRDPLLVPRAFYHLNYGAFSVAAERPNDPIP